MEILIDFLFINLNRGTGAGIPELIHMLDMDDLVIIIKHNKKFCYDFMQTIRFQNAIV